MRIILYIGASFFLLSCEEENKNYKSIYDYNSSQITGKETSVKITISKKQETVYKVECDSLVNFEENILLFDHVDIEIFNNNVKSTNLFSDKAIITGQVENSGKKTNYNFSKSNMIAEGNVVIKSFERDDQLFTNKIMLYNNNRCNILIDTTESVTLVSNKDTIRGFGFESDCELKNWEILKPVGVINKN
tara:strand:- start:28 stop:597 length:570 start_codon:yes stop_codon:yes gene_type:complete